MKGANFDTSFSEHAVIKDHYYTLWYMQAEYNRRTRSLTRALQRTSTATPDLGFNMDSLKSATIKSINAFKDLRPPIDMKTLVEDTGKDRLNKGLATILRQYFKCNGAVNNIKEKEMVYNKINVAIDTILKNKNDSMVNNIVSSSMGNSHKEVFANEKVEKYIIDFLLTNKEFIDKDIPPQVSLLLSVLKTSTTLEQMFKSIRRYFGKSVPSSNMITGQGLASTAGFIYEVDMINMLNELGIPAMPTGTALKDVNTMDFVIPVRGGDPVGVSLKQIMCKDIPLKRNYNLDEISKLGYSDIARAIKFTVINSRYNGKRIIKNESGGYEVYANGMVDSYLDQLKNTITNQLSTKLGMSAVLGKNFFNTETSNSLSKVPPILFITYDKVFYTYDVINALLGQTAAAKTNEIKKSLFADQTTDNLMFSKIQSIINEEEISEKEKKSRASGIYAVYFRRSNQGRKFTSKNKVYNYDDLRHIDDIEQLSEKSNSDADSFVNALSNKNKREKINNEYRDYYKSNNFLNKSISLNLRVNLAKIKSTF